MGRFYKTASPQMVDFMYKIPEQALLKAIEGTDKQIDTENLYVTESQKLLQKKALNPDNTRQEELIKQHQQGIDEVSQMLASSPLAALNDRQKVRAIQKKIYEDVTRGELGAQYKNYDMRQQYLTEETKRATEKDGSINIAQVNEAMNRWDTDFAKGDIDEQGNVKKPGGTAYDPTTGTYRNYATEKLVNYFDATEEVKKQAEGWEPDVSTDITRQYLDKSGNYIITDKQGREILKKDDLTFGLYNLVLTNPEATNFYNQGIRIRSGAKPGTEEYLKEWERVYGVRQQRGNLGSPFATESIMQTVTDPATGKTETKPLTQKVQKYDEKGNPIEGQFEDKEVKRMSNPGEIFGIAQAQAERKDKNKIVSSITQDETEAYKVGLQQQKEIAVAKAKEDDKEFREAKANVSLNNNNAETKNIVIAQKNNKEAYEALSLQKTNIISSVSKKGEELIDVINNSGKPAKEKERLLNELKAIMTPLEAGAKDLKTLDFSKLKNFLVSNKITGAGDVATGIDGLSQSYTQSSIDYKNKNEHYSTLRNISKPKDYDKLQQEIKNIEEVEIKDIRKNNNALYAEYLRLNSLQNNLQSVKNKQATTDAWNKYQEGLEKVKKVEKKLETAKTNHQKLISEWNKNFDANLDYNNKNGANSNTTTVFSSGGSGLEKVLPPTVFSGFVGALKNLSAGTLFPHLLTGSNAVVVTGGKSEATNFDKLLKDNNIDLDLFNTLEDGEPIQIEGGKTMTLKLGSSRVTPGNQNFYVKDNKGQLQEKNIGRGSIQVTLIIRNPKTNENQVSEIYIPKNEVTNANLKAGSDYLEKHYEPDDIKNKAKTNFGAAETKMSEEQKEKYAYTFDGGVYYPHKDKWVFDNDPTVPKYEDAALAYYRNIKGYK
jgi:exonuclease VII small subunit